MIRANSVVSAFNAADVLFNKKMVLGAKPNTVLSGLITMTNSMIAPPDEADTSTFNIVGFGNYIELVTTGGLETPSGHDTAMDELNINLCNAVRGHLSFAKNVVKPLVVQMTEEVTAYVNSLTSPNPTERFELTVRDMPAVLEDPVFVDSLNYYKGKTAFEPRTGFLFDARSAEDIVAAMLTRDKTTDQQITAWASLMGDAYLVNLWNSYFGTLPKEEQFLSVKAGDPYLSINVALGVYLLARNLYNNPEAGLNNMSLKQYNDNMQDTRDYFGSYLCVALEDHQRRIKNGIMVIASRPNQYSITVLGPIYRTWLKGSGSPEVLFGLLVSGKTLFSVDSICAAMEDLKSQWHTFSVLYRASETTKSLEYFKEGLRMIFDKLMSNINESEQDFIKTTSGFVEKAHAYFEKEVAGLTTADMQDVDLICRRLICRARFYYTDAEKILTSIAMAGKVNPDIDVREAALLATIDYVADYMTDMIQVNKTGY